MVPFDGLDVAGAAEGVGVLSVDVVEPPQAVASATTLPARIKESLALLVISLFPFGRPVATIPIHLCESHCAAAVNDR